MDTESSENNNGSSKLRERRSIQVQIRSGDWKFLMSGEARPGILSSSTTLVLLVSFADGLGLFVGSGTPGARSRDLGVRI